MADGRPFDLKRHLPSTAFVIVLLLIVGAFGGIFVYAGIYDIGADAPHSKIVYNILDRFRENAITHHARGTVVPADLNSPDRISMGAGLYNEMCTGCHLGPGVEPTDLSKGLYPQAPELARGSTHTAAQQFWIIKHGIKLSAMPAWGKTHNDQLVWDMVAFIQALPKMSPAQYKAIVASAPSDEEAMEEAMPEMRGRMGGSGVANVSTGGKAPTDKR